LRQRPPHLSQCEGRDASKSSFLEVAPEHLNASWNEPPLSEPGHEIRFGHKPTPGNLLAVMFDRLVPDQFKYTCPPECSGLSLRRRGGAGCVLGPQNLRVADHFIVFVDHVNSLLSRGHSASFPLPTERGG